MHSSWWNCLSYVCFYLWHNWGLSIPIKPKSGLKCGCMKNGMPGHILQPQWSCTLFQMRKSVLGPYVLKWFMMRLCCVQKFVSRIEALNQKEAEQKTNHEPLPGLSWCFCSSLTDTIDSAVVRVGFAAGHDATACEERPFLAFCGLLFGINADHD